MSRKKSITYADFTIEKRKRTLKDPRVVTFLKTLPRQERETMVSAFVAGSHDNMQNIVEHLTKTSVIANAIVNEKGGADIFYFLYNKIAKGSLDEYYLVSDSGHQIYKRLEIMVERIPHILRRLFPGKEEILVDNIASGQGYDMINILANPKNADLRNRIHVRNIDPNEPALKQGLKRIKENGLEDNFEIVVATIDEYEGREAHFCVESGIYCPLSTSYSIRLKRNKISKFLRRGGYSIHNATTYRMIETDLFTDFTMRMLGWKMGFKTQQEIKDIAIKAGFKVDSVFSDLFDDGSEAGFNFMVVAQKK